MLFNSKNNDMTNLPAWMIDGELLAGKVESSSVYRQSLPGVPKMCIATTRTRPWLKLPSKTSGMRPA